MAEPHPKSRTFSADEARQADIVLATRRQRMIFVAGLAGIVIVVLVTALLAG